MNALVFGRTCSHSAHSRDCSYRAGIRTGRGARAIGFGGNVNWSHLGDLGSNLIADPEDFAQNEDEALPAIQASKVPIMQLLPVSSISISTGTVPVPIEILIEETGNNCMIGTLLCLDGRQRLVFILGEVFGVSDEVGAEIAEVTPVNFRQILSRARRDLYEYLRDNCSLVNAQNDCKCARKTRAFIQAGFVDPAKLEFTQAHTRKVRDVAARRASELNDAYMEMGASVYRGHPFYEPSEQSAILRRVLGQLSL